MSDWLNIHPDPDETIWMQFPFVKRLRRKCISKFCCLPDTGWFGLRSLRKHILICGYPRAGTTLLLLMMEHAFPHARHFGREKSGWRAASYEWRNHELMISKVPWDILKLHQIKKFYRTRRASLKTIVLIRDPRDVLTSNLSRVDRRYFLDCSTWMDVHAHVWFYRNDPEVLFVRYEDLVLQVEETQLKIDSFVGEEAVRCYKDFQKANCSDFDVEPLNGLRPLDKKTIGRWKHPRHKDRIEEILRTIPTFPQVLIDLCYEKDALWIDEWQQS